MARFAGGVLVLVSWGAAACGGSATSAPGPSPDNPLAQDSLVAQCNANCVWLNDCNSAAYPNVEQCSLTLQEVRKSEKPIAEGTRSSCDQAKLDKCTKDIKASRCPVTGVAAAGELPKPESCSACQY